MQTLQTALIEESKKVLDLPFSEISVGYQQTFTREITNQDILDFAALSGDVNPIHVDDDFASTTMFKGRIAHGAMTSSFISTLIGTLLPGKNTIYLSQNTKFKAPVRAGDTIKVVGEVTSKRDDKKILTLQTNVYNQNGDMVIEGDAVVMKKE